MTLIRKRLVALQFTDGQIDRLARNLSGTSYADAERGCLIIRKRSVLRGCRQIREGDLGEAMARHDYRQSVLVKATPPGSPSVDREYHESYDRLVRDAQEFRRIETTSFTILCAPASLRVRRESGVVPVVERMAYRGGLKPSAS